MHQVAVYKRLKTMQYYKTVKPTSSCRCLEKCSFMGNFYLRALTGKILVFWRGVCLWEVLTYERWLYIEDLWVIEAANVVVVAVILVNFTVNYTLLAITCAWNAPIINWSDDGSTHSMHFCTTWFPFWSLTHFSTCPSSSLTRSF